MFGRDGLNSECCGLLQIRLARLASPEGIRPSPARPKPRQSVRASRSEVRRHRPLTHEKVQRPQALLRTRQINTKAAGLVSA